MVPVMQTPLFMSSPSFIFVRALTVAMYLHVAVPDDEAEIATIVSCMALGGG